MSESLSEILASTVTILRSDGGHGSGLIIKRGLIATCWHVVEAQLLFGVRLPEYEKPMVASLCSGYPEDDTAILRIHGEQPIMPARLGTRTIEVGLPVYAIGAPIEPGLSGTVTEGIVSAVRGEQVQTSANVHPGNSGGPLVDASTFEVLGLVSSGWGEGGLGIEFAIPSSAVGRALEAAVRDDLAITCCFCGRGTRDRAFCGNCGRTRPDGAFRAFTSGELQCRSCDRIGLFEEAACPNCGARAAWL
jgi:S1-C subfamily serine protease